MSKSNPSLYSPLKTLLYARVIEHASNHTNPKSWDNVTAVGFAARALHGEIFAKGYPGKTILVNPDLVYKKVAGVEYHRETYYQFVHNHHYWSTISTSEVPKVAFCDWDYEGGAFPWSKKALGKLMDFRTNLISTFTTEMFAPTSYIFLQWPRTALLSGWTRDHVEKHGNEDLVVPRRFLSSRVAFSELELKTISVVWDEIKRIASIYGYKFKAVSADKYPGTRSSNYMVATLIKLTKSRKRPSGSAKKCAKKVRV
jgi:hypothetical protein